MSADLIKEYSEIDVVKNRFLQKAEKVSHQQLNQLPENSGWSAGQVLYHCAMAENATIDTINKNLKENRVQLDSNWKSKYRNALLVLFLKLPFKYKAPKIVSSVPAEISYDEIKKRFNDGSIEFKEVLQKLPVGLEDKLIFKHPFLGLFDIHQTLKFLLEHYLHHERQLDALL
jgi:uncharacterized damage-inducible protein DinB